MYFIYYQHNITVTITLTTILTTNAINTNITNTYSRVIRLISDWKANAGKPHQFPTFFIKAITITISLQKFV